MQASENGSYEQIRTIMEPRWGSRIEYIHFSQGGATQSVADPGLFSETPLA
jgi:hypothetical protein